MELEGGFPMTEQAPVLTRHDLEAKIVKRCWEDEGFRKEFTADPAAVFVKYLQVPAASLPKIAIHQETPGSWHIVLPAKPPHADELTEADLERVAGGTTPAITVALSVVGVPISLGITISVGQDNGW
jgi:hypothetical protein